MVSTPFSSLWALIPCASCCFLSPHFQCRKSRIKVKRANLCGSRTFTDFHVCSPASKQWAGGPPEIDPRGRQPKSLSRAAVNWDNCPTSSRPLGRNMFRDLRSWAVPGVPGESQCQWYLGPLVKSLDGKQEVPSCPWPLHHNFSFSAQQCTGFSRLTKHYIDLCYNTEPLQMYWSPHLLWVL